MSNDKITWTPGVPKIKLAADLELPVDALTETFAYIARRGAGKTYGASKLCEGFLDVGGQVVVLDPVGRWYGLRLMPDGVTKSGYDIAVLGGLRGDIPLEPTAGALVADAVVDHGMSVILDVSMFESESHKKRFVADFCERLLRRKKAQPSPMHLFVEEAQEFCPQHVAGADARMVGAIERIIKIGRNFGIGCTLITQRPQSVNKNALNLTGCLVVLQTTGPQERKTLEGWITDKGDGDVKALLAKVGHLQKGEAFVWAPQGFPPDQQAIFRQVKIGTKKTHDASRTPRLSDASVAVVGLPGIDLGKLAEAMAATVESAKNNDPVELRRQLRAQADASAKIVGAANAEVRRLTAQLNAEDKSPHLVKELRDVIAARDLRIDQLCTIINGLRDALTAAVVECVQKAIADSNRDEPSPAVAAGIAHGKAFNYKKDPGFIGCSGPYADAGAAKKRPPSSLLGKGEKIVLTAIAQSPDGATNEQLTVVTGYKRSSRDTYLQQLKAAGLIERSGGHHVATPDGVRALGSDFVPLPTGAALREHWSSKLGGGELAVFNFACSVFPGSISKKTMLDQTGYSRSSLDTYVQRLAARRLLTCDRGEVTASPNLFDGDRS